MSGNPLFEKPEGISWNPAAVELPPLPSIQAGEDSMSATISAALPALHAEMMASITSLQAKEDMFSSKVIDAQSAYTNSDDAGAQSVGQMGGQLGQIGQMAQQAAGSVGKGGEGGGGGGIFSQLMEQAMKAVQSSSGGPQGESAEHADAQGGPNQQPTGMAGTPAGQQSGGGGASAHSGDGHKDGSDKSGGQRAESEPRDRNQGQPTERAPLGQPPAAAGPAERQHVAGPAPVSPPSSPRSGEQDLSRNL